MALATARCNTSPVQRAAKRPVGACITLQVCILVGTLAASLIYFDSRSYAWDINPLVRQVALIGVLVFAVSVYLWYRATGVLNCPYILFFCSFMVFQFGQSALYGLGFQLRSTYILGRFSDSAILEAEMFTIISMAAFNLGGLLSIRLFRRNVVSERRIAFDAASHDERIRTSRLLASMKKLGWLLLIISMPATYYVTLQAVLTTLTSGYRTLYQDASGRSDLMSLMQGFSLASIALLLSANRNNKKASVVVSAIALCYGLTSLLTGGRTQGVAIIVVLLWFWGGKVGKINWKKAALGLLILAALTIMIPAIASIRSQSDKTLGTFAEALQQSYRSNPIQSTIEELGGSMYPLIKVQQIIPDDVDFHYGESYLYALFSLVPNAFDFMGPVHPSAEKALLDQWLQRYLNLSYGPGFSMTAEAYYNFGWLGWLAMVGWGLIMGRLIGYTGNTSSAKDPLGLFVTLSITLACLAMPRYQSMNIVRTLFYFTVVPMIIVGMMNFRNRQGTLGAKTQHDRGRRV